MVIIGEQESDYPRLHLCLCRLEDLVREHPQTVATVLDAILAAGSGAEASPQVRQPVESKLWRALRYGDAPAVMVMDTPGACSHHIPGTNRIMLEKSLVRRFEQAESGSHNARFLGQEVMAIVLQSLVHWLCNHCLADLTTSAVVHGAVADLRKTAFQDLRC